MARLCSWCDLPATHHFAVSYRGQVLRGAICAEHASAVARERLGIQDRRGSLDTTKLGRALTDPITKPHFQCISASEGGEIIGYTRELTFERSFENRFTTRRRRSMSRWRHSRLRGSSNRPDRTDFEPIVIPATAYQGPARLVSDNVHLHDPSLIADRRADNEGFHHKTEDDPVRVKIADAINMLDKYAVPVEVGEKKADQLLKQNGESVVRMTLRAAIKERRQIAYDPHPPVLNEAVAGDPLVDSRRLRTPVRGRS